MSRTNRPMRAIAFSGFTLLAAGSIAPAAILYDPVVVTVGDGTVSANTDGRTTELRLYKNTTTSQVSPTSTATFVNGASGPNRLVTQFGSLAEGNLSNNPAISDAAADGLPYYGSGYVYNAGYDAANGTASVAPQASGFARVVGRTTVGFESLTGPVTPVSKTASTAYSTANGTIRSATGNDDGDKFWTGGNGGTTSGGWRFLDTTSNTQLTATTFVNVRSTEILGGQLFGTSGAGTRGLYAVGTGTPTSGTTITNIIDTGSSSSPYEFVLIDDPDNVASTTGSFGFDTAYIADDRSTGSGGGIQKWTYNGSAWSLAYTINASSIRGLAGQYDPDLGTTVLWASSADGASLFQVTDTGAASTFSTLASASTNRVFRGVALAPAVIPEPASLGLLAAGGLLLSLRRRA